MLIFPINLGGPLRFFCVLLAALILTGCTSGPISQPQANGDSVALTRGNYKIIKAGARGVSTGLSILFIPLGSPSNADAKANLYSSLGQKLEGRSIALVNQTSDYGNAWFVLFDISNITLTADVIEFNDH